MKISSFFLLFKLLLKQKPELLNAINSCNYGPHTNRNLKKSLAMDDCNSFEIDIMLNALKHTCMTNNVSFFLIFIGVPLAHCAICIFHFCILYNHCITMYSFQ